MKIDGYDDIKAAIKILKDSDDLLKIEDILPLFPDFTTIDDFKTEICDALEERWRVASARCGPGGEAAQRGGGPARGAEGRRVAVRRGVELVGHLHLPAHLARTLAGTLAGPPESVLSQRTRGHRL